MRASSRACALCFGIALVAGLAAVAGCSSEEHKEALAYDQAVAAGQTPDKDSFYARVAFAYRSGKDDWAKDKDLEFRIRKDAEIRARATFVNARPGTTYSVHLVWIRPDGRELFRRYAEATVAPADSAGFQAKVIYKKTDDMSYRLEDDQDSRKPSFTVETTLDISRGKKRETGEYLLRVYLDRRLLKEEVVTVVGS